METAHIYRLRGLSSGLRRRLHDAQREAGRVWNLCSNLHLIARQQHLPWPQCDDLQRATKGGQFALHSQTVQMICHKFCTIVGNIHSARRANPRLRYPYREKRFHTLYWPAQAVSTEQGRIVLPMGRGRPSLVLHVDVPAEVGAVQLVWNDGYELHISVPVVIREEAPGSARATVDLGEVRQAAVTTSTGDSLVVSGRGIRSLKRLRNKMQGQIAKKCARCQKGSKRWRQLRQTQRSRSARIGRQVRDLRHKGTSAVVAFCEQQGVGEVFVGNPDGVRRRRTGRHHHQRMGQWEYGKDIAYLTEKCAKRRIKCFTGSERGTSSQCPACGVYRRPKGRIWICRECGFNGDRDVVGSVNMHLLAFGEKIAFPQRITYRRLGPVRVRQRSKESLVVARARTS